MPRLNFRTLTLLALVCAMFLSACGGDNKTPTVAPTLAPTPTPTLPPAAKYTYDNAGRLTQVDYPNGARIIYTYDKAGNLISQEVKK